MVKLVITDHRHTLFHWLVVVFSRIIYFLILTPLGIYLASSGFLLSERIIKTLLPRPLFAQIAFIAKRMPFLVPIRETMIHQLNHWYTDAPVWWTVVVGIPLILIGAILFIIAFFELYYSIISPTYNRTHCPFCKEPIKIK